MCDVPALALAEGSSHDISIYLSSGVVHWLCLPELHPLTGFLIQGGDQACIPNAIQPRLIARGRSSIC